MTTWVLISTGKNNKEIMARNSVNRFTANKSPRRSAMSKTVAKSVMTAAYGNEPVDITGIDLSRVFNWYNYMNEDDDTRPWLFEYMKAAGYTKQQIQSARQCPKTTISRTACTVARIINNGNQLPPRMIDRLRDQIASYIEIGANNKCEVKNKPENKQSIQQRIQQKIKQTITDCEEAIDNDPGLNVYQWLSGRNASVAVATGLRDYYGEWIDDFLFEDQHATAAEKRYNQQQANRWKAFVTDIDRYINNKNAVKVRKVRKRRPTNGTNNTVDRLKYQKQFPPLKIVSVNPTRVIGCKQLWTYNTKTRKLSRFDAIGPAGIQISGCSLVGFDPDNAAAKVVRKPEVTIANLLRAKDAELHTLLDNLSTKQTKPSGRINSNTVLLRAIR